MNKNVLFITAIAVLTMTACGNKPTSNETAKSVNDNTKQMVMTPRPCKVEFDGVTFTHAINGGDGLVTVNNGKLEFCSVGGQDYFIDPNQNILTKKSIPAILFEVDNTKPFTMSAKVIPTFTKEGLYNAADFLVFVNDTLAQKLCYEQDEYGGHRVVSVRTQGTSDDNNHDLINEPYVYFKISSDTHTIASYYSRDGKEWHMVRLYKNYYPTKLYLGIASQCPQKGKNTCTFEDLKFSQNNVGDFRLGK